MIDEIEEKDLKIPPQKCKGTSLIKYSSGIIIFLCFTLLSCIILVYSGKLKDIEQESGKLLKELEEIKKRNAYSRDRIEKVINENNEIVNQIKDISSKIQ